MKLLSLTKVIGIGVISVIMTGCGGSSSSPVEKPPAETPTPPETPKPPNISPEYTITELPLKGIDNPTLLINSTYTIRANKQTYAKFIMKEDGNVLLGSSLGTNYTDTHGISLYDASHNLITEGVNIDTYLNKGEYIVFLNNKGYKSKKYFTLYSKQIDVNYLSLPTNTTKYYESAFTTMWMLKLDTSKVLSMMTTHSHPLYLFDDNGNMIASDDSTISESLNAGTYIINVYSAGRRYGFDLETTLE